MTALNLFRHVKNALRYYGIAKMGAHNRYRNHLSDYNMPKVFHGFDIMHHASALSASTMYLVRSDGFALHLSLYCSKQGSILVVISITLCKWSFKELTVV